MKIATDNQKSESSAGFTASRGSGVHGYATDCLNNGANPRALQKAMGHKSLETTMGYCHAEALSVRSPLEALSKI